MHIVFVSREYLPSLRAGGIATYMRNIAEVLVTRGHKVSVIRASDDTRIAKDEIINGVQIFSLSGGDFIISQIEGNSNFKKFRGIYRFWSYRKKIREKINELKDVDIIEVADFGAEALYLNDLEIPVVFRLHAPSLLNFKDTSRSKITFNNWYYFYQGLIELKLVKQAVFISSCSKSLSDWYKKNVEISQHINIIHNFVDEGYIKGSIKKFSLNRLNKILFVGTITETKGVADLFEAVKLLEKGDKQIILEMAGKSSKFGDNMIKRGRSFPWLVFLGKQKHTEIMEKYLDADIVCLPSWWENMPMVCLEAMASGAIVIGSSSGGMNEIITDGVDGFLLPPRNPQIWAEKIKEVFSLSEKEKESISLNAQKKVKEKFSIDIILEQLEKLYKDVLLDNKK